MKILEIKFNNKLLFFNSLIKLYNIILFNNKYNIKYNIR